MLAEWSEEYFNNRALFSDYYLNERLPDPKITPQWNEDVRPTGREIYKHIVTARKNYTRQTAEVCTNQCLSCSALTLRGRGLVHHLLSKPITSSILLATNRNLLLPQP
jgi:hypothetical protein